MSIVLLELAHTSQTSESTRSFVTVKNTKISNSPWQVSVGAIPVTEHETVARAVHWLESKLLLLNLEFEHVLSIVLIVTRGLPQLDVVHVWRLNLIISSGPVFLPHELEKIVQDLGTIWQDERGSGGKFVKEEEFLLLYSD